MFNQNNIEVEYRRAIKGGHMLKVKFLDLGMYIDGWRVSPSTKTKWWVQPPARPYGGSYQAIVEFDKTLEFWQALELECIAVVEEAMSDVRFTNEEIANMSQEDVNRLVMEANDKWLGLSNER